MHFPGVDDDTSAELFAHYQALAKEQGGYPALPAECRFRTILYVNNGQFPEITGFESERFSNRLVNLSTWRPNNIYVRWVKAMAEDFTMPPPNLYWLPDRSMDAHFLETSGSFVLRGNIACVPETLGSLTHEFFHGLCNGIGALFTEDQQIIEEKFCDAGATKYYIDGYPKPAFVKKIMTCARTEIQHFAGLQPENRTFIANQILNDRANGHPSYVSRIAAALELDTDSEHRRRWNDHLAFNRQQGSIAFTRAVLSYAVEAANRPETQIYIS